jgi:hypothetical protein
VGVTSGHERSRSGTKSLQQLEVSVNGRGRSCTAVADLVDAEWTRSTLPSVTDSKAVRGRRQRKRGRYPAKHVRHGRPAEAVSALGQRPDGEHSPAIGELAEFGQGQVGGEPRH